MTTQPLSSIEPNERSTEPETIPGSFSEEGFTAAFEKGWNEYESQQVEPTKKSLDQSISDGLGDLTKGRPQLAKWMLSMSDLPSMQGTAA